MYHPQNLAANQRRRSNQNLVENIKRNTKDIDPKNMNISLYGPVSTKMRAHLQAHRNIKVEMAPTKEANETGMTQAQFRDN